LISAFAFTACSAVDSEVPHTPWPWLLTTDYEKAVYDIVRRDVANDVIIANGTLTLEVIRGTADSANNNELKTTMSLTYTDRAEDNLKGKTDTIESSVIFTDGGLTSVSSYKKVTLFDRGSTDSGEYHDKSYTVTADYRTRTTSMTAYELVENSDKKYENREFTSDIDFSSTKDSVIAGTYDNEFVYYIMRAYDLKYSGSGTFKIANMRDIHTLNSFKAYTASYTCGAEETGENRNITALANRFGLNENGTVSVIKTTLSLTSNDPGNGPSTTLYYCDTPFKENDVTVASKVLAEIKTIEYNYGTASEAYNMTYTLSDFSVTKE
jgi:hypothetical protein